MKQRMIDLLNFLRERIHDDMKLSEMIDVFDEMSKRSVDEDDMLLFETGIFSFSGPPMFSFSLVRQCPNEEEEFFQLHLEVQYEPKDKHEPLSGVVWNDEVDGDFFAFVKKSDAYAAIKDDTIAKINIFLDET